MKRFSKVISFILVVISILIWQDNMMIVEAETVTAKGTTDKVVSAKKNVATNKVWKIKMTSKIDVRSVTKDYVYVLNESNEKVNTNATLSKDQQTIVIQPPTEGYLTKHTYTLYITKGVTSLKKKSINKSVNMKFTTKKVKTLGFVAKPKENKIAYAKNVEKLSEKSLRKLETSNYKKNKVIFSGKVTEVKALKKNEIIILPATKEYPFGYAKKIVSAEYKKNQTIIQTKEPALEEIIDKKSKVTSTKKVTIEDFKIDKSVIKKAYVKEQTDKKIIYGIAGESKKNITLEQNGDSVKIVYEDIELSQEKEVMIKGKKVKLSSITIDGSVEFGIPRLHAETKGHSLNYLELNTTFKKNLNISYSYQKEVDNEFVNVVDADEAVKNEFENEIDLGYDIPVKLYGIVGAEIGIAIVGEGAISGQSSIGTEIGAKLKVGTKKTNNGKIDGFNETVLNADFNVGKLEGTAEAKLLLRINIYAKIAQFQIGKLNIDTGVKAEIAGEVSRTFSASASTGKHSSEIDGAEFQGLGCLKLEVVGYASLNGNVGTKNNNIPFEALSYENPIYDKSLCDATNLRVLPKVIKLAPGAEELITISNIRKKLTEQTIYLPDNAVKMTIENESIATINQFGNVTINKLAREGDKTVLTIVYEGAIKKVDIIVGKVENHFLEGQVQSSKYENGLSGVKVEAKNISKGKVISTTKTDSKGNYSFQLAKGKYEITYKKDSYKESKRIVTISNSSDSLMNQGILYLVSLSAELTEIKGITTNAVNGEKLKDVKLEFYNLDDLAIGKVNPVSTTKVDANGNYTQNLAEGTYIVEVIPDNTDYLPMTKEILINPKNKEFNFAITPVLKKGNIRIVLSWGENPRDLDAHLYGPKSNKDETFHIYYGSKGIAESKVIGSVINTGSNLDLDDLNGFGPETITIYKKNKNIYRFIVHQYSGDGTLSTSGATVKVYFDNRDTPVKEFTVPFRGQEEYWHVFDLNAVTEEIYEVNELLSTNPMN